MRTALLAIVLVCVAVVAFAAGPSVEMGAVAVTVIAPPIVDQSAGELISMLQAAFANGEWHLVVAAAILILVSLVGRLWSVWSSLDAVRPFLKWIALGLSVLVAVAVSLLSGAAPIAVAGAALSAVSAGLAAIGGWEVVGKWIAGKLSPARKVEQQVKAVAKKAARVGSLNLAELEGLGLRIYDSDKTPVG